MDNWPPRFRGVLCCHIQRDIHLQVAQSVDIEVYDLLLTGKASQTKIIAFNQDRTNTCSLHSCTYFLIANIVHMHVY